MTTISRPDGKGPMEYPIGNLEVELHELARALYVSGNWGVAEEAGARWDRWVEGGVREAVMGAYERQAKSLLATYRILKKRDQGPIR